MPLADASFLVEAVVLGAVFVELQDGAFDITLETVDANVTADGPLGQMHFTRFVDVAFVDAEQAVGVADEGVFLTLFFVDTEHLGFRFAITTLAVIVDEHATIGLQGSDYSYSGFIARHKLVLHGL
ncbi:hypothetical protein D3C86_1937910 [compost metagenome]